MIDPAAKMFFRYLLKTHALPIFSSMKDQITALMEALRLSQAEIEKFRRERQGLETTVAAIEHILADPHVAAAIRHLEPFMPSPPLVPHVEEHVHA